MKILSITVLSFFSLVFMCSKCKNEDPKPPSTSSTTATGINTSTGTNTTSGNTLTTAGVATTTSTPILTIAGTSTIGGLPTKPNFNEQTLAGYNTYKNSLWSGSIHQSSTTGIIRATCNVPYLTITTTGFVLDSANTLYLKLNSDLDLGQFGVFPAVFTFRMTVFADSIYLQISDKDDCNPLNYNYVNYRGTINSNKITAAASDTLCCSNKLYYPKYNIDLISR